MSPSREALRLQLKQARRNFLAGPSAPHAASALARQLRPLLDQLEPLCLGLYWPLEGEFDPAELLPHLQGLVLALPFARREGRQMQYRRWDGQAPSLKDEMGIPSSAGAPADPDVVLVPCLGFTREGYRLGYGGGYFDRWQAAHPGVTTVGLAWSVGEVQFAVEPHDQALTVVVTERELIAP
ncbi:5,10-methenyltetrahydrofolate synthetase [Inhella inkyongensis]|uniref:5-formyltetrahydrofolate cyclo-ligase n=1 Tax=Inhella inkyongensis TaxID=392593 RepID=A0A840S3M6_9BURK|nr:5-formyltetrahydrofolate cyclo-ligase [Inhella inkyongensis]MBB5203129.1 5,10-methenyltetrahydrofolate synthetase [Inhella inkyongensis]